MSEQKRLKKKEDVLFLHVLLYVSFFIMTFSCSKNNAECEFKKTDIYGIWVNKNINFSLYDDVSLKTGSLPITQFKKDSTYLISELDYTTDGEFWLTCDSLYEYNPDTYDQDTVKYGILNLDSTRLSLTYRLKNGNTDTVELIKNYEEMSNKAKQYFLEFRDTL